MCYWLHFCLEDIWFHGIQHSRILLWNLLLLDTITIRLILAGILLESISLFIIGLNLTWQNDFSTAKCTVINNMVPCCHIYKISFLLSALWLLLQNLIFIWCLVGKFTKSHKYKAPTSFLHGALWSHSQNLIKFKAPTRHSLVPCTRQKPDDTLYLFHKLLFQNSATLNIMQLLVMHLFDHYACFAKNLSMQLANYLS